MLCTLVLTVAIAPPPRSHDDQRRPVPDVLLVVLDDVGYEDLKSVRQQGFAPNMGALAATGFVFHNAFSNPICSPTRRSLLFNEWRVEQSGPVCGPPDGSSPSARTISLAERLPDHSALFLGKWHIGSSPVWQETPQSHGWDLWRAGVPFYVAGNPQTTCGGFDYDDWLRVEDGVAELVFGLYQPGLMVRRFEEWWPFENGPRFCVFAAQLAHDPYHRPPRAWLPANYPATPSARKKYEAMIAAIDVQVGVLLASVDLSRTVVAIVGDNGTPREVAPDPTRAKTTTFERGIRVPMILAGAGVPRGESRALVHVVDLHATLVELAGRTASGDGVSLVPIMNRTSIRARAHILSGIRGDPQFPDDLCVRSLRFKLRRTATGEEFYDLWLDPLETTNRILDPTLATQVGSHRAWLDSNLR